MDCIYEGDRTMYINAEECVDCGACRLLCEVDAIFYEDDLPESERKFLADNAAFFNEVLPGRDAPLGAPGGSAGLGAVGVDTPMVAGLPQHVQPPDLPHRPGLWAQRVFHDHVVRPRSTSGHPDFDSGGRWPGLCP